MQLLYVYIYIYLIFLSERESRTLPIYSSRCKASSERISKKSCRNLINHSKIKMRKCEMQRVKGVNWKDRATSSLGLLRMKVNFKRVSHRRYRFPDRWRCSSLWKSWKEIPSPLPYPSVFNCKAIPGFISCEKLVSWLSILSFPPFFLFLRAIDLRSIQSNFFQRKLEDFGLW